MRSIILFSFVSKQSFKMINHYFKQFKYDFKQNRRMFVDFYDTLGIPVDVWYALLKKINFDDICTNDYNKMYISKDNVSNKIYYDNHFWPIRKIRVKREMDSLEEISKMQELRSLKLCFELPRIWYLDDIKWCNKLTQLKLYNCKLYCFSPVIFDLKHLKELSIVCFYFSSIPSAITKLTNLEMLTLRYGKNFAKFPSVLFRVDSLKRLTINDCSITTIPNKIYKLQKLEHLCMTNNSLKTLPSSLIKMPKLKTIRLNNNRFSIFPDVLRQIMLTPEIKIDLNGNLLKCVPTEYKFTKSQFYDVILSILSG
ncbi:MAG TPA: leucine-rich repeat domain-containing protein, partial [Aquella sp.]|nr:leucine-rich repeat domain-containing protein [Aquella sp.]